MSNKKDMMTFNIQNTFIILILQNQRQCTKNDIKCTYAHYTTFGQITRCHCQNYAQKE